MGLGSIFLTTWTSFIIKLQFLGYILSGPPTTKPKSHTLQPQEAPFGGRTSWNSKVFLGNCQLYCQCWGHSLWEDTFTAQSLSLQFANLFYYICKSSSDLSEDGSRYWILLRLGPTTSSFRGASLMTSHWARGAPNPPTHSSIMVFSWLVQVTYV